MVVLSISVSVFSVSYPQTSSAADNKFTAADVLAWEKSQQDWYFNVNASMAAAIASQNDNSKSSCLDDWYFGAADRDARNDEIRNAMARFETYHPTLVMIAVIEKACGELKF